MCYVALAGLCDLQNALSCCTIVLSISSVGHDIQIDAYGVFVRALLFEMSHVFMRIIRCFWVKSDI